MADIRKAGLLVRDGGKMLLCRKSHTTSLLIVPGGRIEAGETPEQCLHREIAEELGGIGLRHLQFVGTYEDAAAGELDKRVSIQLYSGDLLGEPVPTAEIVELVWFGPNDDRALLSPTLANKILPDLTARGLL
jgi:8-oxo-dGTP diphosphatase